MEEIVSALKIRLKSPVFGYFIIALVFINWKEFFYLFIQNGDVLARIDYFEVNTSFESLIIFPFLFAAILSVVYPWLNDGVAWITSRPIQMREEIEVDAEHNLLLKRKQLEEARSQVFATAELELIERAKRDQNVEDIESEELKEKLKIELESLRNEKDSLNNNSKQDSYKKHKELMDIAGEYRNRAQNTQNFDDDKRFTERARELEEKAHELLSREEKH